MNFKDEVNSRLRTPEQIWIENAKSDYSGIKSQILSMAHAGKFVNVAGKRMIEIDYQGMVKNLFKHDYVIKGIKANLFLGAISSLHIPLPELKEQDEIVRVLDDLLNSMNRTRDIAEETIEKIDMMKKSLLAKAFRGELATNNPNEEASIELLKQTIAEA